MWEDIEVAKKEAGRQIRLVSWNLGYGGLGKNSDFKYDGGERWLPPSRHDTQNNVFGITNWLKENEGDVLLLQEVATGGIINFWVNLRKDLNKMFRTWNQIFFADIKTRLLPFPFGLMHGLVTYSTLAIKNDLLLNLPNDGDISFGIFTKRYRAIVTNITIGESQEYWCVINIHFSAFDSGGTLRKRQLQHVLDYAKKEEEAGAHVVIGGDFNLRLAHTEFAHTTNDKYIWNFKDFDMSMLPEGWKLHADGTVPSVRSDDRPYEKGENYTAIIDGFITSKKVWATSVIGIDMGFEFSDHNPVVGEFEIID
jgi:endonuclease/exonuclease/phosphatase family metal-dependent hydrolase